jgi:hypothetical protein
MRYSAFRPSLPDGEQLLYLAFGCQGFKRSGPLLPNGKYKIITSQEGSPFLKIGRCHVLQPALRSDIGVVMQEIFAVFFQAACNLALWIFGPLAVKSLIRLDKPFCVTSQAPDMDVTLPKNN